MKKQKKWPLWIVSILATTIISTPIAEASTYIVQKGDTLTKIAKLHNATVSELQKWNNLKDESIYVTQKLTVTNEKGAVKPSNMTTKQQVAKTTTAKPVTTKPAGTKPTTTKVTKQTTAKPTAVKQTTTKTTIKPVTAKPVTTKQTGQKPTTAKSTSNATTTKPATTKQTGAKPTTVKPKTTKQQVAKPTTAKPTTTKQQVAKTTTTKPVTTKPTTVKQTTAKPSTTKPSSSTTLIVYKVVKGDTLTKVATKFNVTIANLKLWNNISTDSIFVGQDLKINTTSTINTNSSSIASTPALSNTNVNNELTIEELDKQRIANAEAKIAEKLLKEQMIKSQPSISTHLNYSKVVEIAKSLIGTPYVFGGSSTTGFDCSGFVQYVYTLAGIGTPRLDSESYFMNESTVVLKPVAGDVVFFKNTYKPGISHMGIYLGDDQFIHAGDNGVAISKLSYNYWNTKFVAFKRFNKIAFEG